MIQDSDIEEDRKVLNRLQAFVEESKKWDGKTEAPTLEDVVRLRYEGRYLAAYFRGHSIAAASSFGLIMSTLSGKPKTEPSI